MRAKLAFIVVICAACCCHAQEDRPLPPLVAMKQQAGETRGIIFQKRATDAVTIDVRREINKVSLIAENTALYPYTLIIHFYRIRNIVPAPDSVMMFIAVPGTKVLTSFRIFDPSQSFDFDFRVDRKLGDVSAKAMSDFPYLIPLGENKSVLLPSQNLNDTQDLEPAFVLNTGDTIDAMRKGVVTAVPVTTKEIDRIAANSIEIRHLDGTIMVYEDIDPSKVLIELGETVFPGQPLAITASAELFVSLYRQENEKLKKMKILFHVGQDMPIPLSQIADRTAVEHPRSLIEKEMNKNELKRFKRGK